MAGGLQIYDRRERRLVQAVDAVLTPLRLLPRRRRAPAPSRVLLLRLERIGDLLMTLDAIADARAAWPRAEIDLAVGSWNADLARLIPGVTNVIVADVPWLARERAGDSWPALIGKARRWRTRRYDLVVNFEPDVRSNVLAWLSGAPTRVGYWTGGGGALLTDRFEYDPSSHVSANARRLIERAAGGQASRADERAAALSVPSALVDAARARLEAAGARRAIGVHASGGRESKQWHLDRFAGVARALAAERGATIVLTGSAGDRALVDRVRAQLDGVPVLDLTGALDVPALAAQLTTLDLLVTGDTGPMHLAAAVDTPVVALFGPSDPRRYGPRGARSRVIRIDLPCSPCGQVRLPPERCRGHVPDCLDGISVDAVLAAARELMATPDAPPRSVRYDRTPRN